MKLPIYSTRFLACLEGEHSNCKHVDAPGLIAWVCQCDCHITDSLAATELPNNYSRFPPLPAEVEEIVRYSIRVGRARTAREIGLSTCGVCGETRGRALGLDPLLWHHGFYEVHCRCTLDIEPGLLPDIAMPPRLKTPA